MHPSGPFPAGSDRRHPPLLCGRPCRASTTLWLVTLALLLPTSPLLAQEEPTDSLYPRVHIELRGELARPFNDVAEVTGSAIGFGLGAAVQYWETQFFGMYVGWDWYKFDEVVAGEAVEFTDSGIRGGLRYQGELPGSGAQPFVYGGLINARSELHRSGSEGRSETRFERGWGGEVGAGVVIPIWRAAGIVPEARIRFHGAEPIDDETTPQLDVRYWTFNLGVYWRI